MSTKAGNLGDPNPLRDGRIGKFMELIPHVARALGLDFIFHSGGYGLAEVEGEKVQEHKVFFSLRLAKPKQPPKKRTDQ